MRFVLMCEEMDGLILIDKSYLSELNDDLLYAMDLLLDRYGKSELIFDFPDEQWDIARLREIKPIQEFCNQGKMIIWLLDGMKKECEFEQSYEMIDSLKWLSVPTGKLLAVTASELIQCLSYPNLEMEKIFDLTLERGWYAIWNEGIDKIMYCKKPAPNSIFSNIEEI